MVADALFLQKKMEDYLLRTYRTTAFYSRKIATPVLNILLNLHREEDTNKHRI